MRSSKSRSRNKNSSNINRRGSTGNIVNRVFDSAGPEGKVRGTPQQIVEKYQSLSHDAQMAGDRIGSENYAQHAEHYARLLGSAQREMAERRDAMEAQQRKENEPQEAEPQAKQPRKAPQKPSDQPDVSNLSGDQLFPSGGADDSTLVQTPENAEKKPARKPAPRKRKPAPAEAQPTASEEPIIN
jgi:hypothetical protein